MRLVAVRLVSRQKRNSQQVPCQAWMKGGHLRRNPGATRAQPGRNPACRCDRARRPCRAWRAFVPPLARAAGKSGQMTSGFYTVAVRRA